MPFDAPLRRADAHRMPDQPTELWRKLVHTEIVPIRWGDMDAMGHVNNTVYFRYMEQARIAWFDRMRMRDTGDGFGPIIVNASCSFLKQLVYPGDVEVQTFAGEPGRSSFETFIEMRPSYDAGTLYATGTAKVVWIDYAKAKSVPLPDRIRELVGR